MSFWNYRIMVKTATHWDGKQDVAEDYYAVHEVFYDSDGTITGWTADPVDFGGESKDTVISMLETALDDARQRPVLRVNDDDEVEEEIQTTITKN